MKKKNDNPDGLRDIPDYSVRLVPVAMCARVQSFSAKI